MDGGGVCACCGYLCGVVVVYGCAIGRFGGVVGNF